MNLCFICQEPNEPNEEYCAHCGVELSRQAHRGEQQLEEGVLLEGHLERGVLLEERYEIERVLGSGGFAHAYLATDIRLKRACVVKEMLRPSEASLEEIAELERNFEREVQALVALNHPGHPNIPEIYDYFLSASGHYLVMKYIEGQNLEQMLAQKERLAWKRAVKIGIAVCDALVYMHSRQPSVLHRDIKPANILRDHSGRVWLVDFGLSKAQPTIRGGKSGTTAFGTAGYTALEQWMERAVPASDIYALGATLHHLLTGRDPRLVFDGEPDLPQVLDEHGNFPPIRQFNKTVPQRLTRLLSRAVDALPTQRPTAQHLLSDLQALLAPARALAPFNFRNGQAATSPIKLVSLSLKHWQEARDYLYNGPFEKWFEALGQYDEVREILNLTQQFENRDIGLDKFLRFLDPNLPAPRVDFEAEGTDFGHYTARAPTPAKIKVTNHGPGCFYGIPQLDKEWLNVSPRDFALAPNESLQFMIEVQLGKLQSNQENINQLTITSHSNNGPAPAQSATFNFSLYAPARLQRYNYDFSSYNILNYSGDEIFIILFKASLIAFSLFLLGVILEYSFVLGILFIIFMAGLILIFMLYAKYNIFNK